MSDSPFARFVVTVVGATMVIFILSVTFAPPDPFTQLLTVGLLVIITLPIAYYLSYRGGFGSISMRVNR